MEKSIEGKVVIPAEVADLIEELRERRMTNIGIVSLSLEDLISAHGYTLTLRRVPPDTLLSALVNGYEREMTEIEAAHAKIRKDLEYWIAKRTDIDDYYRGYAHGHVTAVQSVLHRLQITIEGVNAE